jgi:hypothetical protein
MGQVVEETGTCMDYRLSHTPHSTKVHFAITWPLFCLLDSVLGARALGRARTGGQPMKVTIAIMFPHNSQHWFSLRVPGLMY